MIQKQLPRLSVLLFLSLHLGCVTVEKPPPAEPAAHDVVPEKIEEKIELTVTDEELKRFPLVRDLAGDAHPSGLRYWTDSFSPVKANGAYVSVIHREDEYELWRGSLVYKGLPTQGRLAPHYQSAKVDERVCIVSRGPTLNSLGKGEVRFDATLIDDVHLPKEPGKPSNDKGFTRTSMNWFPGIGYVFYCCVTHGYSPGAVPLLPAIMVSETGEAGTWKYLGKMKGEPAEEASKRVIWSDGGSIHLLDNGTWRAYLNGYGQVATAVESKKLDGEWKFLRDGSGKIRELLPGFPKGAGGNGVWLHVLRVADKEWHLWLTDTWPAQSIWHFSSKDGLTWKPYGLQPEITRIHVGGHGIKCMRTFLDPTGEEIVGLLSVWGKFEDRPNGWVLHTSRMPIGLQPKDRQ